MIPWEAALRAVNPISRSKWNGGFSVHSGPSRGDPCRRALRPIEASKAPIGYVRNSRLRPSVVRKERTLPDSLANGPCRPLADVPHRALMPELLVSDPVGFQAVNFFLVTSGWS